MFYNTAYTSVQDLLLDYLISIEKRYPSIRSSIMEYNKSAEVLYHVCSPSLPESYIRQVEQIPSSDFAGSCGAAVFRKASVIVSDIGSDPKWETYRSAALEHGLHACWSTPIFRTNGDIFGTLAIYFTTEKTVNPEALMNLELAATWLSEAIDHFETKKTLQSHDRKYNELLESIDAIIWELDFDQSLFTYVNPQAERWFGYSSRVWLQTPQFWKYLVHPDDQEHLYNECLKAIEGWTSILVEYRVFHSKREISWVKDTISAVKQDGKIILRGIMQDVTDFKAVQQQLARHAYTDLLTEVPNRNFLIQNFKSIVEQSENKQWIVINLDVDRFRNINEHMGYDFGDKYLQNMTECLIGFVQGKDGIVSRIGGDQFVLCVPVKTEQLVEKISWEISLWVSRANFQTASLHNTLSMGMALFPDDSTDIEALLRYSEMAMYRAKEEGGNQCRLYDPSLDERTKDRIELEKELRKAIQNREFILHYQPKFDFQTGRIESVEALVRWLHPVKGLIYPGEFIPLAEETGLIDELGWWVLEEACKQCVLWYHDHQLKIAVNLSARQFQQRGLVQRVFRTLQETGLAADMLEIEITETMAVKNIGHTMQVLTDLKGLGLRVSLDDFGTGFSSLSYLRHFQIDTLKIDSSFVQDIENGEEQAAIVSTIIDLARNLRMRVVAEGVETIEQLSFLREKGCDEVQGYLISRPIPPEELNKLLLQGPMLP